MFDQSHARAFFRGLFLRFYQMYFTVSWCASVLVTAHGHRTAFCTVCLRNGATSRSRNEHNLAVNQAVSVQRHKQSVAAQINVSMAAQTEWKASRWKHFVAAQRIFPTFPLFVSDYFVALAQTVHAAKRKDSCYGLGRDVVIPLAWKSA